MADVCVVDFVVIVAIFLLIGSSTMEGVSVTISQTSSFESRTVLLLIIFSLFWAISQHSWPFEFLYHMSPP
ncbi:MAG: hypothetical protein ACI8RD_010544 [Bacillariaceae sp.]|jgi:hypothetical protein